MEVRVKKRISLLCCRQLNKIDEWSVEEAIGIATEMQGESGSLTIQTSKYSDVTFAVLLRNCLLPAVLRAVGRFGYIAGLEGICLVVAKTQTRESSLSFYIHIEKLRDKWTSPCQSERGGFRQDRHRENHLCPC